MIISPVIKFIVDKEAGFPAPSEKEKLNRAISKFRSMLKKITGAYNIAETEFGLADMLVGRGEPADYKEAMAFYDDVLKSAPTSYLKARALVGKAELVKDIDEAISLCGKAFEILKGDLSDFFAAKCIAVEGELLSRRNKAGDHKRAAKLLDQIIKNKKANEYFRARAMVGRAELLLYLPKPKGVEKAVKMCKEAVDLLKDRPNDYFAIKAKVVESEIRIRRERKGDLERAGALCESIIRKEDIDKSLIARAKLVLAQISKHPKAVKLYKEVLEMEGLDPYIIEKARQIERSLRWAKQSQKKL